METVDATQVRYSLRMDLMLASMNHGPYLDTPICWLTIALLRPSRRKESKLREDLAKATARVAELEELLRYLRRCTCAVVHG